MNNLFCIFVFIFVFQIVIINRTSAQYENLERIISFDSEITINNDASMTVDEQIQVYAAGNKIKRGIYRDFPTKYKDQYGNTVNIKFELIEVSRDGISEDYHTENLSNGIRVYCGRSDFYLPEGEYLYSIKYKTVRQIGFFVNFDELYWNATGNGWELLIEKASATINLPAPVSGDELKLFGYTGYFGLKGSDYKYKVITSDKIFFQTTSMLNPGEGLTIVVQFPKGLVYEPNQTDKINYFIQDNLQIVIGIIGILVLIFYYMLVWWRVGKDPSKGVIIPLYEPPLDLSPAAVRFISQMGYDNKSFTTTIVSLAVKGYLKIEEDGKDYILVRSASNKPLTHDESSVLSFLKFSGDNARKILELNQKNHTTLQEAIKALKKSLKNSYEKQYFYTNRKYFFIGLAISFIILLTSILGGSGEQIFILVWITFWSIGVSALIFSVFNAWKGVSNKRRGKTTAIGSALFLTAFSIPFILGEIAGFYFLSQVSSPLMIIVIALIALVNIIFYHLLKAPTLLGRKIMDKIDGFKMYLETAEKDRLYSMTEPEKTPELFEAFLPYALALGVENKWAEKFSDILSNIGENSSVYKPDWYSGPTWSNLGVSGFASTLSGSFSNSISSSSAAPGSSSGGGGGGSSGGGGGGGGGGGW